MLTLYVIFEGIHVAMVTVFLNPLARDQWCLLHTSSGDEDPVHFLFDCWCLRCSHNFHSKHHTARHFTRCPKPHAVRCGCCGADFPWQQFVHHVNTCGVCECEQSSWNAPLPSQPRYNISCGRSWCLMPISSLESTPPVASALLAAPVVSAVPAAHHIMISPVASPSATTDVTSPMTTSTTTRYTVLSEQYSAAVTSPYLTPITEDDLQDIFNDITVTATAGLASSSLHSPQMASESSVPVQPLYTAQSPAAQTSLNAASPVQSPLPLAALPDAAASPAASSVSAATSAFPDDPHIQVALAAHALWLARVILAGTETTAQQVTWRGQPRTYYSRWLLVDAAVKSARDATTSAFAPADAGVVIDIRAPSPLARLAALL